MHLHFLRDRRHLKYIPMCQDAIGVLLQEWVVLKDSKIPPLHPFCIVFLHISSIGCQIFQRSERWGAALGATFKTSPAGGCTFRSFLADLGRIQHREFGRSKLRRVSICVDVFPLSELSLPTWRGVFRVWQAPHSFYSISFISNLSSFVSHVLYTSVVYNTD